MAATKGLHWTADRFRKRIKAGMLRKKLQDHVFDPTANPLTQTQLRAAEILLKKCVPDLSSTEITGDGGGPLVTRVEVVDLDDDGSGKDPQ